MREFDLLKAIYTHNAALPADVVIPPGDDMGAVRIGDETLLVTVDQVADGVHVDLASAPLAKLGRKAITRNLSDVAAMGAVPVGCVAAGCLPRDFGEGRANELFDAMRDTAAAYGCPLMGGDISMWDGRLLVSVTVIARPDAGFAPITRRGAQVGDAIVVTGKLGGSLEDVRGYVHHLDFEPRLDVARVLGNDARLDVRGMIDLSDGLASDLRHILPAAATALVDASRLPLSDGAKQAAGRSGKPAWRHAMCDGEDYELCFAVQPEVAEMLLPPDINDVPLTVIGRFEDRREEGEVLVDVGDGRIEVIEPDAGGWEHRGDE